MPIYEQTYRTYDGELRRRFRWWTMVKQELRVLFTQRFFVGLLLLGMFHFFLRVLQVVTYDMIRSDPNNPLAMMIRGVALMAVDERMFFDFIRMQAPIVFLCAIYAGSGLICDDFRNNLMEVYFSKPMSWRDYVIGKVASLALVGLMLTAAPGLFLLILHNLLAPGWKTLQDTYWLPPSIVLFSLIIVLPCTLGVLASSALFRSQRFSAIAVFMVLFGNLAIGTLLAESLHKRNYLLVAFPAALDQLGGILFRQRRLLLDLPWHWPALYVGMVCLLALWLICRTARRAETAA